MTPTHCPVCEQMGPPTEIIPVRSTILTQLQQLAHRRELWQTWPGEWEQVMPLPVELVAQEPFFQWLQAREPFQAALIRMSGHENYNWHVDTTRGVAVNMLVAHEKSTVLFATRVTGCRKPVHVHDYEIGQYYVFNTQVPHTITNLGSQDRILFTTIFERKREELTFQDLAADIRTNYRP